MIARLRRLGYNAPMMRLVRAVRTGIGAGLRTAVWLLLIMLPVSFVVLLLRWTGVLEVVSDLLSPVFRSIGLPGSSALVFLSSLLVNLYSGIAVMSELALSMREVTTIALMCLIAHNFLVEIAVLGSTGSNPLRMVVLRLAAALVAGLTLSLILPANLATLDTAIGTRVREVEPQNFTVALAAWGRESLELIGRISLILLALMTGEALLQELGVVRWLGRRLGPVMRVFGLPEETAFLWVVSNTLGLAYGAGVLRREVSTGRLSSVHGDLLNHHIAISHSLLEDTLLFVVLGVPALWITVPRLLLAFLAVWARRMELAVRARRTGREDDYRSRSLP